MDSDYKNKTPSISNLLEDNDSSFAALFKKANSIQEIDHRVKELLDPSLKNNFELANINTDTAIILVSSSAWATRLRYNIPAILDILHNQLNYGSVKTVRIKIKKPILEKSVLTNNPVTLSNDTAQFLHDVADNFTDPELRQCILKLSKNRRI